MKSIVAGIAAVAVLVGTPVRAADMAAKAPPIAPSAPFSWTGFYLGLNAGYGWADNNVNFINGDPPFYGTALALGAIPANLRPRQGGFIGGGQAGYNLQSGTVVYGIETDIQYANVTGTASVATVTGIEPNITTTAQNKLDWLGTLRPRFGVLVAPTFLAYATGGLAYGRVSSSANTVVTGPAPNTCSINLFCSAGSTNQTRVGWTAGGGLEYAVSAPWSVKVEYLYVDLGHDTYNVPCTLTSVACTLFPGTGMQATTAFHENLLRAGVNYKF